LKAVFPPADQVGKLTVFNIGGNKVRLVAAIHYNRRRIYIRAVTDRLPGVAFLLSGDAATHYNPS
jgi:mRNA-degrading endonuclease HigB of HigAB toxin-antitoxin module